MRKRKDPTAEEINKKKKAKVKKSTKELLPHAFYDEQADAYKLEDGKYMDMVKIRTKDLVNASSDELEFDLLRLAKLYKITADDLKLIALNFPCDCHLQKTYFEHKIDVCKNDVFKQWMETRRQELEYLEKNNTSREYYLMFFADSPDSIEKNRDNLRNVLGDHRDGLIQFLLPEKKNKICAKLNNKNMSIA